MHDRRATPSAPPYDSDLPQRPKHFAGHCTRHHQTNECLRRVVNYGGTAWMLLMYLLVELLSADILPGSMDFLDIGTAVERAFDHSPKACRIHSLTLAGSSLDLMWSGMRRPRSGTATDCIEDHQTATAKRHPLARDCHMCEGQSSIAGRCNADAVMFGCA